MSATVDDRLAEVALAIERLPHGEFPRLSLGLNLDAFTALVDAGAKVMAFAMESGQTHVEASLSIGTVEIAARTERPSTDEEKATLAASPVRLHSRCAIVSK